MVTSVCLFFIAIFFCSFLRIHIFHSFNFPNLKIFYDFFRIIPPYSLETLQCWFCIFLHFYAGVVNYASYLQTLLVWYFLKILGQNYFPLVDINNDITELHEICSNIQNKRLKLNKKLNRLLSVFVNVFFIFILV